MTSETGKARLPDGTELSSLPLDRPFSQTDMPGIYTLSVSDHKEQIAVNLAADESRTTPMTPEQLESFGLKTQNLERPNIQRRLQARQRQLQLAEIEQSQKLWQTILLMTIMILLVETFLSGFFGSRFFSRKATASDGLSLE
jgi:hypothetical protein